MGSSSWYHPYSWASRMSQTFLYKVFFSFVLQLFTESSLWGWMQGSKYIYIFPFLCKNIHTYYQVPFISNNRMLSDISDIFFLFCNWVSISRFSRHYVKPQSKFCCTFVNISLILTNDWQLMQFANICLPIHHATDEYIRV